MLYVGLDVHRRRTQVAVMDESDHALLNRYVPNGPERLSEVSCGADPGTPVVSEAAYGWSWLAELLKNRGLEVHMAQLGSNRARRDSSTLASTTRPPKLPRQFAVCALKHLRSQSAQRQLGGPRSTLAGQS